MGACVPTLLGGREENHSTTGTNDVTKSKLISVVMSAAYAAGGDTCDISGVEAVAANNFTAVLGGAKMSRSVITDDDLEFEVIPAALYDPATLKIKAIDRSTGAEVAPATDLSGETIEFEFVGN